jgi:hypothetical protein
LEHFLVSHILGIILYPSHWLSYFSRWLKHVKTTNQINITIIIIIISASKRSVPRKLHPRGVRLGPRIRTRALKTEKHRHQKSREAAQHVILIPVTRYNYNIRNNDLNYRILRCIPNLPQRLGMNTALLRLCLFQFHAMPAKASAKWWAPTNCR